MNTKNSHILNFIDSIIDKPTTEPHFVSMHLGRRIGRMQLYEEKIRAIKRLAPLILEKYGKYVRFEHDKYYTLVYFDDQPTHKDM
jgi:hypothetical protein